jgi:DNA-binding transcriptional MocR family regulator
MSAARRSELARLCRDADLYAIEDRVYSFLVDEEPLAALLPDRSIVVDSMSKRMAPGLTLGFLVAPPDLVEKLVVAVRAGAWPAQGFPFAANLAWMADGTVGRILAAKRADASARQALARRHLADYALRGDARAYHVWVELPETWRAELFAGVAARRGIALTPSAAFTIGAGHAPNAVRLALASPGIETLDAALASLRALIRSGPESASFD